MQLNPIAKNQTELVLPNGNKVFFSYSMPVAACLYGQWFVTSKRHSSTTSKHIKNYFNGMEANKKDQVFFDSLVKIPA